MINRHFKNQRMYIAVTDRQMTTGRLMSLTSGQTFAKFRSCLHVPPPKQQLFYLLALALYCSSCLLVNSSLIRCQIYWRTINNCHPDLPRNFLLRLRKKVCWLDLKKIWFKKKKKTTINEISEIIRYAMCTYIKNVINLCKSTDWIAVISTAIICRIFSTCISVSLTVANVNFFFPRLFLFRRKVIQSSTVSCVTNSMWDTNSLTTTSTPMTITTSRWVTTSDSWPRSLLSRV